MYITMGQKWETPITLLVCTLKYSVIIINCSKYAHGLLNSFSLKYQMCDL
uniref:Uncharacterized protein n=1 Tax=Anguilla anguilla TaxID=7936 RepID=A0A0E9WIR1_ANGAN